MKCFKCKKEIIEENPVYGYGKYFHRECYEKFKKESNNEVEKMLTNNLN